MATLYKFGEDDLKGRVMIMIMLVKGGGGSGATPISGATELEIWKRGPLGSSPVKGWALEPKR